MPRKLVKQLEILVEEPLETIEEPEPEPETEPEPEDDNHIQAKPVKVDKRKTSVRSQKQIDAFSKVQSIRDEKKYFTYYLIEHCYFGCLFRKNNACQIRNNNCNTSTKG